MNHTGPTDEQLALKALYKIEKDKENEELRKKLKRKRKRDKWTEEERKAFILYDYSKGMTTKELEAKYNLYTSDIRYFINYSIDSMINYKERNILNVRGSDESFKDKKVVALHQSLQKLKDMELVTQSFLSLLSPSTEPTLTDEESLFSQLYVRTGDSEEAIKGSSLDVGLQPSSPISYRRALLVRSAYLREKPNVKEYIDTLRSSLFSTDSVDKKKVQELLVEEIYKMKEKGDPRDKVNLRQTIELLGKTIGAFTERIEVQEIDPSKSLDALIEMAKEAEVRSIE